MKAKNTNLIYSLNHPFYQRQIEVAFVSSQPVCAIAFDFLDC